MHFIGVTSHRCCGIFNRSNCENTNRTLRMNMGCILVRLVPHNVAAQLLVLLNFAICVCLNSTLLVIRWTLEVHSKFTLALSNYYSVIGIRLLQGF